MNNDRMRVLAGLPVPPPKVVVVETVAEVVAENVMQGKTLVNKHTGQPVREGDVIVFRGSKLTIERIMLPQSAEGTGRIAVSEVDDSIGYSESEYTPEQLDLMFMTFEGVENSPAAEVVIEAEAVKVEDKAPELDAKAENKTSGVKVPADVTAAINSRIAELKQSIKQYNDKGYNDGGVKPNAIEALEKIAADLKLEDGLTVANVFYGTLMSPITDLFPPKVVKFLHTAPKAVKEGVDDRDGIYKTLEGIAMLTSRSRSHAQVIYDSKLRTDVLRDKMSALSMINLVTQGYLAFDGDSYIMEVGLTEAGLNFMRDSGRLPDYPDNRVLRGLPNQSALIEVVRNAAAAAFG